MVLVSDVHLFLETIDNVQWVSRFPLKNWREHESTVTDCFAAEEHRQPMTADLHRRQEDQLFVLIFRALCGQPARIKFFRM